MSEIGINCYEMGIACFENGQYEDALRYFIEAYEQGAARQEILENIYACYINPNEQEFRRNYEENSRDICRIPYEKLVLDFIPVSDTRYYIFDCECHAFLGVFDMEEKLSLPQEKELESLLVADLWDIRGVLKFLTLKNWSTVYFVLNEQKTRFASFLKLPGFAEIYLSNAVIFESSDIMQMFFQSYPEYYLPRQVVAPDSDKYIEQMNQIHDERVSKRMDKRDNVFLSICIPSYNRGSVALRSVQNILMSRYDAEIEVIVSNNGSVLGVEEYKQIEEMEDSRVVYFAFEENQEYASNICNVLSLAHGHFAIIASDEDEMIVDNLGAYMRYLLNHAGAGLLGCAGVGPNFLPPQEQMYEAGYESISKALNWNYVTGMTINTDYMRQNRALERFEEMRGNLYLEYYAHCVIALFVTQNLPVYISDIVLWAAGQTAEPEEDEKILRYMWPESRIEQLNTSIEILGRLNLDGMTFFCLVYERMAKAYLLVRSLYLSRHKAFVKEFSWREVLVMLHQNNWKLIETWKERLGGEKLMRETAEKLFFEYLQQDSIYDFLDGEEKWKRKLADELAWYENKAGVRVIDIDFEELDRQTEELFIHWKQ